jgi:hypothetical protein
LWDRRITGDAGGGRTAGEAGYSGEREGSEKTESTWRKGNGLLAVGREVACGLG